MVSETRFPYGDETTVNGLSGRELRTTQSNWGTDGGGDSADSRNYVLLGVRVWRRTSGGVETEITSGTPVAQVQALADIQDEYDATWDFPQTDLNTTDCVVVRYYYYQHQDLAWYQMPNMDTGNPIDYITEQLGATRLSAATWTFHYNVNVWSFEGGDPPKTFYAIELCWGNWGGLESRITNFTWETAAAGMKRRLRFGIGQ